MDDTSGNALPSPSEESVPSRIPTPMSTVEGPEGYQFPRSRVRKVMRDSSKTPLFLVGFGAFSPITFLHLRIFEQTADYVKDRDFELIGGTISPVNDGYNKAGMASGQHRLAMCSLAAEQTSDWLMVDDYEIRQLDYTPTALVLNHVDHEINTVMGGVETSTGAKKEVHIGMVCGADLLDSMRHPGVWAEDDLRHIFDNFSVFCVERMGTDLDQALESLERFKEAIFVVAQPVQNDVSSTSVRRLLRQSHSIKYLVPDCVVKYINEHAMYMGDNKAQGST